MAAAAAVSMSQTGLFPHKLILKQHYCWQAGLLMKCHMSSIASVCSSGVVSTRALQHYNTQGKEFTV